MTETHALHEPHIFSTSRGVYARCRCGCDQIAIEEWATPPENRTPLAVRLTGQRAQAKLAAMHSEFDA